MVQNRLTVNDRTAHELLLNWLNLLTSDEIESFFWRYHPVPGGGGPGLALSASTAKAIVSVREKSRTGFRSVLDVEKVTGVGVEVLGDMKMQAREAIALSNFSSHAMSARSAYEMLSTTGPGGSLTTVIEALRTTLKKLKSSKRFSKKLDIHLEIPFVGIIREKMQKADGVIMAGEFLRIRTEPWAFVAHDKNLCWKMNIDYSGNRLRIASIERGG